MERVSVARVKQVTNTLTKIKVCNLSLFLSTFLPLCFVSESFNGKFQWRVKKDTNTLTKIKVVYTLSLSL